MKSSNGARERRPVVRLQLALGELVWPAEVTLTSRDAMGFPMLLGRVAMTGRFIIDPQRSYIWGTKRARRPR